MKPYAALTERGQARRLRPLAWNALQQYDLQITRLSLVTNDLNGIFRVDAAGGQKYILRISLPESAHTRDHLATEVDWLQALARDTGIGAPRPIPAGDGAFVVEAAAAGVPEPRLCVLFTWVPGTDLAEHLTPLNASRLGALAADLHAHALTYRPPAGLSLVQFDRVFPYPKPVVLFDPPYQALFPAARRRVYEQAIDWVQSAIDRLKACGEPLRILHGDLHQWNVRFFRGALFPIDFEDILLGWPVQDIAGTFYSFLYLDAAYPSMCDAFRQGYTRRSPWPERCPHEIDAFIAAQGLSVANFILTDPNPAWRIQAPEYVARVETRLRRLMDI